MLETFHLLLSKEKNQILQQLPQSFYLKDCKTGEKDLEQLEIDTSEASIVSAQCSSVAEG